jgi:hypothetical protein
MPRSKRPSFLTKQKEQQRRAKADRKREERRARRKARTADAPESAAESAPADTLDEVTEPNGVEPSTSDPSSP